MAQLFGKTWTQRQLLERVGDPSQLAYARPATLVDGKAKGVSVVDFNTGSGFRFTVVPDRCLDITLAEHCGRSLAWRSPVGEVNPAFEQPEGLEWLYGFAGGLMTTCGLTYHGAPCADEGRALGLHGRASFTPAHEVKVFSGWEGDAYMIGMSGRVAEVSVFGPHLVLNRSIHAVAGEDRVFVHDEVVNMGHEPAPHMMLYHINVGFPALDERSRLVAPSRTVTPRDAQAAAGFDHYAEAAAPRAGFAEEVFYHDLADLNGKTMAGVVNPDLAFGMYVAWRKSQLPLMVQWRQMGKGTYVMGLEPATNPVGGRAAEREAGRLRLLKPGETAVYDVEIGALPGRADIVGFEKAVRGVLGRARTKRGEA